MNPQNVQVTVIYICPTSNYGQEHYGKACVFVESLLRYPAGHNHKFVVVSNGGPPDLQTEALFAPFSAEFFECPNTAKDISGYQNAAAAFPCDLMVFLGGSTYIRGKNWLKRCVQSFAKYGPGLYGAMGHTGAGDIYPHIRTTGFWMPPQLMNAYPVRVTAEEQRYPFEHGSNCLSMWVEKQRLPLMVVTWQGCFARKQWGGIGNGFHQGMQEGLIFGDRLSAPPFYAYP